MTTLFCMQCSSSILVAHPETAEGLIRCGRCAAEYFIDADIYHEWFLLPAHPEVVGRI